MNNKLVKVITFVIAICLIMNINLGAKEINQASSCVDYTIQVDNDEVEAGRELKVSLSYESKTPICTASDIEAESVTINFAQLLGDYGTVTPSYDSQLLHIDTSSEGIATITFNDYDEVHNTLQEFDGLVVFTIRVSSEVSGEVIIENSITDDISINVNPPSTNNANTSKWSDETYAKTGDIIDYNVRINTAHNEVEKFQGIDTPAEGLSYIDDSFYVTNLDTGNLVDESNYQVTKVDGGLVIESNNSFSSAYVIHYQMLVTTNIDSYLNRFEAIYDSYSEVSECKLDYDISGSSQVEFTNGLIAIQKVDEENNPLAGAEFKIIDENGTIVDNLITDESGYASSISLALGNYQVIETKAPTGYILDSDPKEVVIADNEDGLNITNVVVVNQKQEVEKPENIPTASIEIKKVNEDNKPLANAKFEISNKDRSVVQSVVTNKQGIGLVNNLPLGEYTIVETAAPKGYLLDDAPKTVMLDTEEQTFKIKIINSKENNEFGGGQDIEVNDSEQETEIKQISKNNSTNDNEQNSSTFDKQISEKESEQVVKMIGKNNPNPIQSTSLANTGSDNKLILVVITILLTLILVLKAKLK